MTQVFLDSGDLVPVTVLEAGPCRILQVKTPETDGYSAWQLGFNETKKKVTKPLEGHCKKAGGAACKFIKEVPPVPDREASAGDTITVEVFQDVKNVNISGITKGKGFSGTIKRWNYSSGPRSHGCKNIREIGTVGSSFAGRIFPGRPMPGQMGNKQQKVLNLKVVSIDPEKNLLLVKGAVPGPNGGFLYIEKSSHTK